jgi:hypothetical protein
MAPDLAASPDARVIQNAFGLLVVPRDVFKRVGNTFKIANMSQVTVHVSFNELPTNPANADIPVGQSASFEILNTPAGSYEYRVEIDLTDNRSSNAFTLRASGGSDPRIIIDF